MTGMERKREGFLGQKMVIPPGNIRRAMKKDLLINALYITDIGYYPHAEYHYRKREEGADEFILIYCVEGHGWIDVNSVKNKIRPNSYFIIPTHTAHNYGAAEGNPWSIYWVHFTGSSAPKLYEKYCLKGPSKEKIPEVIQIPFEERRINYFNGIISLLESGYSTEIIEYVNISLWQLLASFMYHDFFSEIRHQNNETNIVDSAIKYMQENLNQSISVKELAYYLNYSPPYVHSLFKKETGYSPIHYFNHLKIQKACQYLSFTDMSIKEISFELGFNDPSYFSRLFKKLMELSSTEYRKRYRH
ncbi:MAG: AraC family transcriptional regulator [Balneolaceae bacterium]